MSTKAKFFTISGIMALLAAAPIFGANGPQPTQNAQPKANETPQNLQQNEIKQLSEAFGHYIGRNLNPPGVKFDLDSIIKGMRDGAAGKPAPMSEKEYEQLFLKFQKIAYSQMSQDNLKIANDYLLDNAKKENVVTVEPGKLQYLILAQGNGETVKSSDSPMINYTGKFADGKVFSSSEEVGVPITVPLEQTIAGFTKGIVGMKEGEKRRLFIHPDLGYGLNGQLPPNSLLIFDIEVIKANAPESSESDELDDAGMDSDLDKQQAYLNPDRYDDTTSSDQEEDDEEESDPTTDQDIKVITPQRSPSRYITR